MSPHSSPVRVLLSVLLLLAPLTGRTIVNMESLHLRAPNEGLGGEVSLAWSGASGNTDKSDLAAGARIEWQHGAHTDFAVASYAHGEVAGTENTNRSFLHLRHIFQHRPELAWEGFAQGERNEFARLSFRGLLGAGARFTLLARRDNRAAYFGLGAMAVHEEYTVATGIVDDTRERLWRANAYLVLKYQFRPGVRLVNSLYYQPALNKIANYRLLDTLALHVDLVERLSVRIGIDLAHDSEPPATVEETDLVYRTGLNWSF